MKKLTAAFLAFVFCCISLSSAAQMRTDRMANLMAHIPSVWLTDGSGTIFQYFDAEASLAATIRSPAGLFAGLMGGSNPNAPYLRLVAVPWSFASAIPAGMRGEWQQRVGFDPDQISTLLSTDLQRTQLMLLDLTDDAEPDNVGQALLVNDHQARPLGAWSTWWRGDDDTIDREARDPANPFGGDIGRSSRVASDGNVLVYATAWAPVEAIAGPPDITMTELPEMASITRALNDARFGDSRLVQAIVLPEPWQAEERAADVVLPPWQIGVLADLSDGLVDYGVAVMVYDDTATAETLTQPLLNAWQNLRSVQQDATFAELTGGDAQAYVVGGSPAALVLAIERPMEGEDEHRNLVYQALAEAYLLGDLGLLATQ